MLDEEYDIDPFTGHLRAIPLMGNSIVQTGINRNILYTKSEVDAMIASLQAQIAAGGGGTVVTITGERLTMNGGIRITQNSGNRIVQSGG